MVKKLVVMMAWIGLALAQAHGKVIVSLHVPPPDQLTNSSLWSLDLTNTSDETLDVYLQGEITEASMGRVGYGETQPYRLMPYGNYRLTPKDIKLSSSSLNPQIEKGLRLGVIPEGSYEFCVRVYDLNGALQGEDCEQIEVAPVQSIQLISPADGDTVLAVTPLVFSWLSPYASSREVTHKLRIVEINPGQTKEQAMQTNPTFFESEDVISPFQYPLSAPAMEDGHSYAWQIQAFGPSRVGRRTLLQESDIWEFTVVRDTAFVDTGPITVRVKSARFDSTCDKIDMTSPCCEEEHWHHVPSSQSNTYLDDGDGVFDPGPGPDHDENVPWDDASDGYCRNIWFHITFPMQNPPCNAHWVSGRRDGRHSGSLTETYFTVFNIDPSERVCEACLDITVDDGAEIWLNDHYVGNYPCDRTWYNGPVAYSIPPSFFRPGQNVLKVQVTSGGNCNAPICIGALYCLHYCTRRVEPDVVLRVDSVIPGECSCLCCDSLGMQQSCPIRVHVSDTLGACSCPINDTATLTLFSDGALIFSGSSSSWTPDNPASTSGWFTFDIPMDVICSTQVVKPIEAHFYVTDTCGHDLVPTSPFVWTFLADASPPHISLVEPVCAACNADTICFDTTSPFSSLKLYIDDRCGIDTFEIKIITTTQERDGTEETTTYTFTPSSEYISVSSLNSGKVISIDLCNALDICPSFSSDTIVFPSRSYYKVFKNVSIHVWACDRASSCYYGTETPCNCTSCEWVFYNPKIGRSFDLSPSRESYSK